MLLSYDVALLLNRIMGPLGFWGFSLGLLGAGISSALTIPLGMVLTLEELYGLREESSRCARQHFRLSEDVESTPRAPAVTAAAPPWVAAAAAAGGAAAGGAQGGDLGKAAREGEGAVVEVGGEGRRRGGAAGGEPGGQRACGAVPSEAVQLEGGYCNDWSTWSRSKRWRMVGRPSVYCFLLLFSLIPSLLRLPTIAIITTAQVANGVLLPIVASTLLMSLNHAAIMGANGPQAMCQTCLMLPCVATTVYLASVVLLKQTLGRVIGGSEGTHAAIVTAMPVALVAVTLLILHLRSVRQGAPATGARAREPFGAAERLSPVRVAGRSIEDGGQ